MKELAILDLHGLFWKSTAVTPASSTHLASGLECNSAFLTRHEMDQKSERCHLDDLASHLRTLLWPPFVRATGESDQPASVEEEQRRGWAVCSPALVMADCVSCSLEALTEVGL